MATTLRRRMNELDMLLGNHEPAELLSHEINYSYDKVDPWNRSLRHPADREKMWWRR